MSALQTPLHRERVEHVTWIRKSDASVKSAQWTRGVWYHLLCAAVDSSEPELDRVQAFIDTFRRTYRDGDRGLPISVAFCGLCFKILSGVDEDFRMKSRDAIVNAGGLKLFLSLMQHLSSIAATTPFQRALAVRALILSCKIDYFCA